MTYPVKVVHNVRVPMADGTTLAADLYMPDVPGGNGERWPAIIEYTPYHKVNNSAYGPRATRYPYFASQGYVFVNADIRGTGDSEGHSDSPTSTDEVRDGVELIRWCAKQPWCSGAVGMIGLSYTGGVCYDAARQAPEELKAVVVCQMCSDWYDGMAAPGGSPRPFAWENYAPLMAGYNYAPPSRTLVGEKWHDIWQQRLDRSTPWSLAYLDNLRDGAFWEARLLRGDAHKVRAATFLIGGWCDWYPDDFLKVYAQLRCPKRVLIGPWTHNYPENAWPLPRLSDRFECLRWFDKYLKGIDTDPARPLEKEAPVSLFVRGFTPPAPLRREDAGAFRHEAAWPITSARDVTLALGPGGTLRQGSGEEEGYDGFTYRPDVGIAAGRYVIGQFTPGWGMSDDQRFDEGLSLVYSSPVLEEPVEVVGVPRVVLHYEATSGKTFISAKLCDVAPDGTSVLVSKGVLNLGSREYRQSGRVSSPRHVGAVELALLATAYRFAPGHRIRLMIAGSDVLNAWPTPEPYEARIHRGARRPSALTLPVVASRTADAAVRSVSGVTLQAPVFQPSEFPAPPVSEVVAPEYAVTRDLIRGRLVCTYTTNSGVGVNRSTYTVDLHRPAVASVESGFEYPMDRLGHSGKVVAKCVTSSDEQSFRHDVSVEVILDGAVYWSRRWSTTAARGGM
ncbi:MAG: CocE/NonD family hydrolase [Planctomycetes bacterium]|nr:CocE/NonD family hydrolase [Planctomycetota bacterium]